MAFNFVYVECPNCRVKIKIDADRKYQDCPECKYEFRTTDAKTLTAEQPKPSGLSLIDKIKKASQ